MGRVLSGGNNSIHAYFVDKNCVLETVSDKSIHDYGEAGIKPKKLVFGRADVSPGRRP